VELRPFVSRDNLDNGYQDWREAGAELAWRGPPGRLFLFRARETDRYGLRDVEAAILATLPYAGNWSLSLEGSGTSSANVLPEWSAAATVARVLGNGWIASGSWKETRYTTSEVSMATVGLERYVGNYRFAYTAYLSRPHGEAWSPTHRLAASWYGEGLTRLEAGAARGRESENTPAGLITTDVRNLTLSGCLGISPALGLTMEFERQRQGDFYTRKAIRLGARVLF
jgi:YaiO family outer membrane protein